MCNYAQFLLNMIYRLHTVAFPRSRCMMVLHVHEAFAHEWDQTPESTNPQPPLENIQNPNLQSTTKKTFVGANTQWA